MGCQNQPASLEGTCHGEAGMPALEPRSTTPADYAAIFKALGDPTRLRIFKLLMGTCCPVAVDYQGNVSHVSGPSVGEVCCHITGKERVTSTVSEHLKELRLAKLITMERRGKNVICAVSSPAPALLTRFFQEEPESPS